ncbi:MAG TPA: hypothetical protein VMM93_00425 [Vicinamibacterales bacterium]|nr:hypothetical protein [Vicinamibacterales bacterium]
MKGSRSSRPAPRAGHRAAEVVLDVDVDADRVHLVLVNCGDAVATHVHVEFSRPLAGMGDAPAISDLPVFTRLGVLRPGRALQIFWDAAPVLLARGECAPFVATVSWSERSRRRQRAEYHHDLSIYRCWPQTSDRRA